MRVGLPVESNKQLESEIAENLKAAPVFLIFDTVNEGVEVVAINSGCCGGLPTDLDVIIFVDGMGNGMFKRLQSQGVKLYQTDAVLVKDALKALKDGQMNMVESIGCCGGHGKDHHHEHQGGCCGSHEHHEEHEHSHSGCCGH